MIYVANPYTHRLKKMKKRRFQEALDYTVFLCNDGEIVFSPIVHSHPLAEHGVDASWEYWKKLDLRILSVCDELHVMALKGWNDSIGVMAEIEFAFMMGIPVYMVDQLNDGSWVKKEYFR